MAKRVPHPRGGELTFDPKWHSYSLGGHRLMSVSKVLDKYFPFNSAKVSAIVASKQQKTPTQVMDDWRKQAVLGSNVHAHIEALLQHQTPPSFSTTQGEEDDYISEARKAVEKVCESYDTIGVEVMVASPDLGLAGTIDYLGRNKQTGAIFIGDWKTTGQTLSNFRFSSFESPSALNLAHLPNSKVSRYALQVLTYGYIMRTQGYESVYGSAVVDRPMEFGIIQFGKSDIPGKKVVVEFKKVRPDDILPIDDLIWASPDAFLERILTC